MAKQSDSASPFTSPELFAILRCPQDPEQSLKLMAQRAMTTLGKKIERQEILNGQQEVIEALPEAILVREDGAVGYPVEGGVALLSARDALILKR